MSVDAAELTAEQLRAQTLAWLEEQLPAGWLGAIDAGDEEQASALRKQVDYADWCVRLGEAGYATPTWPAEYGAGTVAVARRGQGSSTRCSTTTRCRGRSTSSGSAWAARRSWPGGPRR